MTAARLCSLTIFALCIPGAEFPFCLAEKSTLTSAERAVEEVLEVNIILACIYQNQSRLVMTDVGVHDLLQNAELHLVI